MPYIGAIHGEQGGDRLVVETSGVIRNSVQYGSTSSMTVNNYGVSIVSMYAAASSGAVYVLDAPDSDYLGNVKTLICVSSSENHVEIACGTAAFVVGGSTYGAITYNTSGQRGGGTIQLLGASSGKWYVLGESNYSTGYGSPRIVSATGA